MVKTRSSGTNVAHEIRPDEAGVGKGSTTTKSSAIEPSKSVRVTRLRSTLFSEASPSTLDDEAICDPPEEDQLRSPSPPTTFPLLNLPIELRLHVIKQLGWTDLKSSRQVSKTMELLASEILLARLRIPEVTSKTLGSMSHTRLKLQELSVTQLDKLSSLMRPNSFQIGRSIRILNFKNPILTKASLKWLFKSCSNLETLKIDYVNPCYKPDWSSKNPRRVRFGADHHDDSFQRFLNALASTISTCSNLLDLEIYAGQFAQILFRQVGDDFHYWGFPMDGLLACPKLQRINMISYAPILMKRSATIPEHGCSGTLKEFNMIWLMDLKYLMHEIKFIVGQAVFATGANILSWAHSQTELKTKYFPQLGYLILSPYFDSQYDRLVEVIQRKCWSRPEFKDSVHSQEIVSIINFFWSNDEGINTVDHEGRGIVLKMIKSANEVENSPTRRVNVANLTPACLEGFEFGF